MNSIGKYVLEKRVFLAPMAGVTDLPFRKLCKSLGAGMVTGEMNASEPGLRNTIKSRLRGVHLEEPEPRSIQIVGWCPKMMAEAARFNADQGASIIDINMGCPAKKVCKKAAGSALLAYPDQVEAILKSVVDAVDVPVTLKIRTGTDPDHRNGVQIAKIAEDAGISLIAVHGRTRADMYNGNTEFETIKDIKKTVSIPVIANGDMNSFDRVKSVLQYTGCDGVMIGRAAHGAPWFPGQVAGFLDSGKMISPPSISDQHRIVVDHLSAIHRFYGPAKGVRIARKHIKWYVQSFPGGDALRAKVNIVSCTDLQIRMVDSFYSDLQEQPRAA
jgi:tRNA-dihydrouridine synthase B